MSELSAAAQKFTTEAAPCIDLKLGQCRARRAGCPHDAVRRADDIGDDSRAFHPTFVHQIIGQSCVVHIHALCSLPRSETIFGFRGPKLKARRLLAPPCCHPPQLFYGAGSLLAYMGFSCDEAARPEDLDGAQACAHDGTAAVIERQPDNVTDAVLPHLLHGAPASSHLSRTADGRRADDEPRRVRDRR